MAANEWCVPANTVMKSVSMQHTKRCRVTTRITVVHGKNKEPVVYKIHQGQCSMSGSSIVGCVAGGENCSHIVTM